MKDKFAPPMCLECERLWKEYQRATNEHLHLVSDLNPGLARCSDRKKSGGLIRQVSVAPNRRATARGRRWRRIMWKRDIVKIVLPMESHGAG